MSGESASHVALVGKLIDHVRRRHLPPRGLLMLADHPACRGNLPPRIGGFLPDLFASDLPATFEVLGEAKTIPDLLTDRSKRQITAFLDHLAVRPSTTFYLYVPPFSRPRAIGFMKELSRPSHGGITIEVLDGV